MEHLQGSGEFCRLLIHHQEDQLLVDLALESPARDAGDGQYRRAHIRAGGTRRPQVVALFDRAAPRDFVDVYSLARLFAKPALLARAAMIDLGFDTQVLASMLDHLDAYCDADLLLDPQIADIPALRAFFADWAAELRAR